MMEGICKEAPKEWNARDSILFPIFYPMPNMTFVYYTLYPITVEMESHTTAEASTILGQKMILSQEIVYKTSCYTWVIPISQDLSLM